MEEETRVTPTPTRKEGMTPTRKEETRTSQLRDVVQEAYLEDSDSGRYIVFKYRPQCFLPYIFYA